MDHNREEKDEIENEIKIAQQLELRISERKRSDRIARRKRNRNNTISGNSNGQPLDSRNKRKVRNRSNPARSRKRKTQAMMGSNYNNMFF